MAEVIITAKKNPKDETSAFAILSADVWLAGSRPDVAL